MDMGRNILLLLLVIDIFLVSLTVGASCPYQVPECTCEQKKVTCNDLNEMPELRTGSDVIAVTEAYFRGGEIHNITDNSLPPGLITLEFYSHPLTNISDDALQDSASTLNQLTITYAKFRRLPRAISKLTKLTSLVIKVAPIDVWNVTDLQQSQSTLRVLTLNGIGLSSWPIWLSNFHSLTALDLSLNYIGFVPGDAFVSFKDTLTQLTLSDCKLTQVPKAVSVLKSLTNLDLSFNDIASVNGRPGIEQLNTFPCASTLQVLDIGNMKLTVLPNLSNMTRLQKLDVSDNNIAQITGSLLPGLTDLSLELNKLTSVPTAINDLLHLTTVDLSSNEITEIDFNQIPPTLVTLDLDTNQIINIIGRTSGISAQLHDLLLNSNPISNISSTAFNNLPSLMFLSLTDTDLTEIPLALTSLTGLGNLMLPSLPCPQPPPKELVYWYRSHFVPLITGKCTNGGGKIHDYMRACQPNLPCDACTLMNSVYLNFSCCLLLLTSYFSL